MLETSLQGFVGRYLDALAVGEDPIAARGIGLIIDRFAISVRRAHEDSTGFSLSGRTLSRWFPGSRLYCTIPTWFPCLCCVPIRATTYEQQVNADATHTLAGTIAVRSGGYAVSVRQEPLRNIQNLALFSI